MKRVRLHTTFWIAGLILAVFLCFGGRRVMAASSALSDRTPKESASSDLKVVHTTTVLSAKRWIQSFTYDSRYFYFIQMIEPYKGHLRVTRVKYKGIGKYTKAYMDLYYFGHGTNLDCSQRNGVTYLWTGGDCRKGSSTSRSITAFRFAKGKRLYYHGQYQYQIPYKGSGKYVTNVYPAVTADGRKIAIRYTVNKRQYFQIYKLSGGIRFNPKKPVKTFSLAATKGDFQGFDINGNRIYTIEGSPRRSFLLSYDRSIPYRATKIRTYNYKTKKKTTHTVKGAKTLSFREPEGIRVNRKGKQMILFVSNKLTFQYCNLYSVK